MESTNSIPKIIHQIWIGPNKLPERCKPLLSEMKEMHPDWEHKLWTNKEVFEGEFKDDPFLVKWKDKINTKYLLQPAFIADRVRLLILAKYGGVYVDIDAKPIKSFNTVLDKLPSRCTFFAGLRPNTDYGVMIDVTVLGSAINSRIVNKVVPSWYSYDHPLTGFHISIEIAKYIDTDVTLLNNDFFYSYELTDKSVILHNTSDRLGSWEKWKEKAILEVDAKMLAYLKTRHVEIQMSENLVRKKLRGRELIWHGDGTYTKIVNGKEYKRIMLAKNKFPWD